ncbi:aldehyde dehydrogenase family protein [Novosphingobium sp. TH158]|uniref:aldehyde dehydrogenase family protein n=1 Tax=Novosphingobium sp. TH158 TaxID=2067455 RepID=UPI00156E7851|nr:aldehyde dehydrogenase family protein [Novosphingobium sp. TH158]
MELEQAGYIDGRFVRGEGERFTVTNPSDGSTVAEVTGLSGDQVGEAIAAARRAFDTGEWSALPRSERAAIMRRYAAALAKHADRLKELAVLEAGCPVSSSVMFAQVQTPLRHAAEIPEVYLSLPEIEENPLPMHERLGMAGLPMQSVRRYLPHGVVSAIAAYNVPLFTALWKVIPALVTGNTVVLRPNPLTPLSALLFAEAAEETGLPPGVLNVVIEGGIEGGQMMSSDPRVDMVSFTGSVGVGIRIAEQAAPTLKPLVLELGGKSAQIFLPDSVEKAAMHARVVCVSHAGQGCALGTRIFVPEESKAAVLQQAKSLLEAIRIGPASDTATELGPVIDGAAVSRCERIVAEAVAAGATVVTGGKRWSGIPGGHYFEPTLLDLPDNTNPAAQEEVFGPVVSVIGYRDLDHAIAMANDSRFGLSGWVHGADKRAALKVGEAMRSGSINVNNGVTSAWASMGGIKLSGQGRERGPEGIRAFQQMSVLNFS